MAELSPRMKELVQPYLAGIEPYDPNFTPTRINLSADENTYPVPAGVREAVDAALAATPLNRYPDPMSNDLRDELAAWHGVTRENICVGNGGDELLYNYLLAFGGAGRTLLNCPPCFSEYAFFASLCQTEVRDVWRDPASFELDQAAVLAAAPACNLAIVTSPNNPTGDVAPLDFVAALCDACPGMVMVDEAYVEFADDSFGAATTAQGLIAERPNLVILHTLSKAFGAAGTRLGYVIAAPEGYRGVRGDSPDLFGQRAEPGGGACLRARPRCVCARGGTGRIRARARTVRPTRNGCRGLARGGMAERGEFCARAHAACHARARASARRVFDSGARL